MKTTIRQAERADVDSVSGILTEAATWLEELGDQLWTLDELLPEQIIDDVCKGLYFLAERDGQAVGTLRYQLEDELYWPDVPPDESAFVHRVAVRRQYSGGKISTELLQWAVARTAALGRPYLRLDCEAARPKLREVYERFGFRYHSDRQVGPHYVARYEYPIADEAT
jgi:GNAT superfamily N-acetyltransferase